MSKWGEIDDTVCPIARSTAIIGDRWTMLFIRELFAGCATFDEIQAHTGATAQMLAARLKRLEDEGIVQRRLYSKRPVRHEYVNTQKGSELLPVIVALRNWGEAWCKDAGEPKAVYITHRKCGTELTLDNMCPACHQLVPGTDMEIHASDEWVAERAQRLAAFKAAARSPRNTG